MKKRGAHASTWKMELMHGTEKQGLLHHFLDARPAVGTPAAPWAPKTWCLTTKEQGFAGSGAPRPVRRRRLEPGNSKPLARAWRRSPPRRSPMPCPPEAHPLGSAPPRAGGPSKKDRRTVDPPNFPNFPNLLNPSGFPSIRLDQVSALPGIPLLHLPGFRGLPVGLQLLLDFGMFLPGSGEV